MFNPIVTPAPLGGSLFDYIGATLDNPYITAIAIVFVAIGFSSILARLIIRAFFGDNSYYSQFYDATAEREHDADATPDRLTKVGRDVARRVIDDARATQKLEPVYDAEPDPDATVEFTLPTRRVFTCIDCYHSLPYVKGPGHCPRCGRKYTVK